MERARTIGERIRALREARNWTQSKLAREAGGASRQHIWRIEHDRQRPGAKILLDLAHVFGVSPEYLLGTDTEKDAEPHLARAGV